MKARGANCAGTNHETSTTTNAILENEKEENFDTSFNSFGRSSNCDEDDTQSNIFLEEDVNDLNQEIQKIRMLHGQFLSDIGTLARSQVDMAIFCSKIKQENQTLTQKVHMLEERIRGLELQSQSQERLIKEQKRNKDLLQRLEREKTLGIENYAMRSAPQIMMPLV